MLFQYWSSYHRVVLLPSEGEGAYVVFLLVSMVSCLQGWFKNTEACPFVLDFVIEPWRIPGWVRGGAVALPRVAGGGSGPPTYRKCIRTVCCLCCSLFFLASHVLYIYMYILYFSLPSLMLTFLFCVATVLLLVWNCLGTVWELLGNVFETVRELFGNCWGAVGELFRYVFKTCPKLPVNCFVVCSELGWNL